MAFDIGSLLKLSGPLQNFGQTILGGRMQAQGSEMQAQGFRQAASGTLQAADFNNSVLNVNTQRRLEALGREIRRVGSEQTVAAVSSGFASTSKSKLAVMDATLDQFSRQIQQEAVSLGHQQQSNLFEAQSAATSLETRARATEFKARDTSRKSLAGTISSASTLLTSIGGLF